MYALYTLGNMFCTIEFYLCSPGGAHLSFYYFIMCTNNVTHLLCLNTAGLQSREKRNHFSSTHLYPPIMAEARIYFCIQEAHSTPNSEKDFLISFQYDCAFGHGTESAGGMIIGFRRDLDYCVHGHSHVVGEGRGAGCQALIVHCTVKGTEIVLVNVYIHPTAPVVECRTFFIALTDRWREFGCPNIICCGDFNLVMDPKFDTTTTTRAASSVSVGALSRELNSFVDTQELVDSFWVLNPYSRRVTHFLTNIASGKRLDYFFVVGFFLNALADANILPRIYSDHNPITLDLQLVRNDKGRGYWKFPDAILENEQYVEWMHRELQQAISLNDRDTPRLLWDMVKCSIQELTCRFLKQDSNRDKEKYESFQAQLAALYSERDSLECPALRRACNERILRVSEEWNTFSAQLNKKRLDFNVGRKRQEAERSSKYFFHKYNAIPGSSKLLYDSKGTACTTDWEILKVSHEFYSHLYHAPAQALDASLSFLPPRNSPPFFPQKLWTPWGPPSLWRSLPLH